jgi:hypothetical protein
MKIITQSIAIGPTRGLNLDGECTHLIRMGFRHEGTDEGTAPEPVYLLYRQRDNTAMPICPRGRDFTEILESAAFKNAETSKPCDGYVGTPPALDGGNPFDRI